MKQRTNKKSETMRTIEQALNIKEIVAPPGLELSKIAVFCIFGILIIGILSLPLAHAATYKKTAALIPSINNSVVNVAVKNTNKDVVKYSAVSVTNSHEAAQTKENPANQVLTNSQVKTPTDKPTNKANEQNITASVNQNKDAAATAKRAPFYLKEKHPIRFLNNFKKSGISKKPGHINNRNKSASYGIRHSAKTINFNDNDQITLVLSRVDSNLIEVNNDKIKQIAGSSGEYDAKTIASGAAYINVTAQFPFTLFVTTEQGHVLSLFVIPKSVIGKTIVLNPLSAGIKEETKEKASEYQNLITALITGMVNHIAPDGYSYHDVVRARHFDFYGIGDMALVGEYNGALLKGLVFSLKNTTHHEITISENSLYQKGIAAIALSKQTLMPGESGLVFDIVEK